MAFPTTIALIDSAMPPTSVAGGLALVAVAAFAAFAAFVIRQRRAATPIYDLAVAGRRVFWVAACAGIIVFGTLMGAMFIGQQYLQNVLGYSTLEAGLAILPAAAGMIAMAPRSARLVETRGARVTLQVGYACCLAGFVVMALLWTESADYWRIGLGYLLVGMGVGFAGTPAARSLTSSVPVSRAGMASSTTDLQRDLGGAIMQSLLGALLAAGYASSISSAIAASSDADKVTDKVQAQLQKSFSSATEVAERYPQQAEQITAAAKSSFLAGDQLAYLAGIVAILVGASLVHLLYPDRDEERALIAGYATEDAALPHEPAAEDGAAARTAPAS